MGVLSIEEEYWTVQYLTSVIGRGMTFWPEDGEGRYGSEDAAEARATSLLGTYSQTRVNHVIRKTRYGQPVTRVLDASSTDRID